MRTALTLFSTLLLAGTANAAPPSVDANCALYGECKTQNAATQAVTEAVPEDAAPAARPGVRTSKTRGFSMAGPSTPAATTAPKRPATATATPAGRKPATVRPKPAQSAQAMQAAEAIRAAQLITFRSGSADLTPEGTAIARQLATAMMRQDKMNMRFSLEGHTDAVGSRDFNLTLSQRRASALAAYLVSQGIAPGRLSTVGYGFDKPLAGLPGTSAANRRVEVRPAN